MDSPNPSSMRVLIRPPNSTPPPTLSLPSTTPLTPPIPTSQSDHPLPPLPPPPSNRPPSSSLPQSQPSRPPSPSPQGGVVVVGFIGRRHVDVTQLINRILDGNVFGSGNLDKSFCIDIEGISEEVKDWFKCRRISYYHEDEKGILYLQFSSTGCPAMEGFSESSSGFDSVLEEREFGDLQGILFMFSVCHVIIFILEGSRFDSEILKKFRILQAAKCAMAPFVRSQTTLPSTSGSHSSSSSRTSISGISSNNPSSGRSGGILSRNASAISLMSGLGSYTSLFPGQCTPVTLFVFLDDFSDVNSGSNTEESAETSSLNQSSGLNSLVRPSLPLKGSGPVVVLARPVNKSEGGFRKKFQSSLEAQIRFLIKKCRTLTGSESSHAGSRSGGISNSAPLFSLDASRAVALVDRSNQRGESLDFATGLVEDVLNGKATSDLLLLESHYQSANKEDIISVKEFIYRQSDILRGRGGLVTNTNSGSAAGMVAVAAAAAAASAASGKTYSTPELPSLEIWLSSSQCILHGVLSGKRGCMDEPETGKRKSRQRNSVAAPVEGIASRGTDPFDTTVSCLESGKGMNTKFSTLWCQRALPAAKEVYLSELPVCYPTLQHEERLEKALRAFLSMVKGPAVPIFMKKLEDECTSIWRSGRQLCDAVSLTGNPCMHQRHDVETGVSLSGDGVKPHSSGFVFLHACACGRSRRLQSDPFDFETANITNNCFPDCDKLLPALQLPQLRNTGPIQLSSWSLIRVGGSRYYEPSKGLLQSGFRATQKFLLKWTIFLEKQKYSNGLPASSVQKGSVSRSITVTKQESTASLDIKKAGASQLYMEEVQSGVDIQRQSPSENIKTDDKKISFGRGIPNFTMRKPFSEVVAGSATADSGFPPLQSRKHPLQGSEKGIKQSSARARGAEQVHGTVDYQESQKSEDISAVQERVNGNGIGVNGYIDGNPLLQIGSNVVPVSTNSGQKIELNTSLKHAIVYVGFEHECPHGHRFILTPEHLTELVSPYSLPEESHIPSSVENSDQERADPSKLGKNGGRSKAHQHSNGLIATAVSKVRHLDKSKERLGNGDLYLNGMMQFSRPGKEQNQTHIGILGLTDSVEELEAGLQSVSLDDGGWAFSLLNRNLPIYMNCPHCRICKNKKDVPKVKFAGTISQLKRIFLVTPPFPVILATCPVIQFEASCLPPSIPDREQKLQFSVGCRVILPPESFLSLKLPFVYGVQLEDGSLHPLKPLEHQPELTAWITKGTTLQVIGRFYELSLSLMENSQPSPVFSSTCTWLVAELEGNFITLWLVVQGARGSADGNNAKKVRTSRAGMDISLDKDGYWSSEFSDGGRGHCSDNEWLLKLYLFCRSCERECKSETKRGAKYEGKVGGIF
ncbi:hypothetical protein F0562_022226 [Nyssa sinensis]|uniref:Nonsense-mediated mRNA decay factor SMG8 n=1 Tax=Nyssa sinensis TaxID=561372 RepID=A0A5J5BN13_9ASTE|nr:hypothetical protein F0562_022226 [Nyssa sinensis]